MATMNLTAAMPVADYPRPRREEPFDAALLCSKLEAHKLARDGRQMRSERRPVAQPGTYYPRNAARQFTATATPMKDDDCKAQRRRSKPMQFPSSHAPTVLSAAIDGTIRVNPKQLYAAMSVGMSESEVFAATTASEHADLGSAGLLEHRPRRARETAAPRSGAPPKRSSAQQCHARDRDVSPMHRYKPGDAARRRVIVEPTAAFTATAPAPAASNMFSDLPSHRIARDKENEMPYALGLTDDDEQHAPSHPARPRLVDHHDRNDWAQMSQYGEDMRRHTLHMPSMHRKGRTEPAEPRRPSAQSDHLITDAVRLLKKEEKVKRRESIRGFFKKF